MNDFHVLRPMDLRVIIPLLNHLRSEMSHDSLIHLEEILKKPGFDVCLYRS